MELWISGGEIDQIIGVGKGGMKFGALGVIEKRRDFLALQRAGEPLHIVLHKNLHGRAVNGTGSLDGPVHAATDRHVRPKKDF